MSKTLIYSISLFIVCLVTRVSIASYMGDYYLFELMMTSYEQLKELNDIVRTGKELNDNFQKVMEQIDQRVYQADRVIMWSEDMKGFIQNDPETIDDYLFMLRYLKDEKITLENKFNELMRKNKKSKSTERFYIRQKQREKNELLKQQSELPTSLSPDKAQIKTANNTKEILIQQTKMNMKQNDTNILLNQLVTLLREEKEIRIKKKYQNIEKYNIRKKGVLKQDKKKRKRGRK